MSRGIHVEITIGDPSVCQVAPQSSGAATVTSVTKIPHPEQDGQVIKEFTATTRAAIESDGGTTTEDGMDEIFSAGTAETVRFTRQAPQGCVCEQIEREGCPVREVNAVDGRLRVQFIAGDHETLQRVVQRLADSYDDLNVTHLLNSTDAAGTEQLVVFDVGAMTDRQREVMATAHEMGYFDHPKSASAADVADALGIARSTFTEHVAAAQQNLLEELLDRSAPF